MLRLRDLVTSSLLQYSRKNFGTFGSELVHEHHLKAAEAIERIGEHPVILVSENTAVVRSVKDVGKFLEKSQWPFAVLTIIPVGLAAARRSDQRGVREAVGSGVGGMNQAVGRGRRARTKA